MLWDLAKLEREIYVSIPTSFSSQPPNLYTSLVLFKITAYSHNSTVAWTELGQLGHKLATRTPIICLASLYDFLLPGILLYTAQKAR